MKKLLGATSRDTVRSRAFTGKPARQLRTAWTDAWDGPDSPGTLPMPLQYMAVAEANRRIWKWAAHPERSRAHELAGFPVGQIVGSMKEVLPSSQVVYDLVEGFVDTVAHLQGLLEAAEKAAEKPAK
jgi:NAD(P)H-dependent flavin oxidoreductase YrpB (nitropropane dioxygenase family)